MKRIDRGGYVFYCSKCKFEHDGECEPAAPSKETLEAIYRDTKAFANAVFNAQPLVPPPAPPSLAWPPPGWLVCGTCPKLTKNVSGTCNTCRAYTVASHGTHVPTHGSVWQAQTRTSTASPWTPSNPSYDYRVVAIGGNVASVVAVSVTTGKAQSTQQNYVFDHWLDDGADSNGIYLRFVPVP